MVIFEKEKESEKIKMSKVKLTIKDWKKRALVAESEIKYFKVMLEDRNIIINNRMEEIRKLKEQLHNQEEHSKYLRFHNEQRGDEIDNLTRVIMFLGDKVPQKEYHSCEENLRNRNQCMTGF